MTGLPRRRVWRRALLVWAVVVVLGGGLTFLLRDAAESASRVGPGESSPSPSLPEGWESLCPQVTEAAERDGNAGVLCFFRARP
ncbi:hypothetical protein ACIQI8_19595 [Streptomyces sp. NPDC092369]|uniref:hypothetical protein n=1 Tax=Streptomyces sp. NPDC092369 TaxID=3366015 RepID=UPI00380F041B